jgi:hypothetical protein
MLSHSQCGFGDFLYPPHVIKTTKFPQTKSILQVDGRITKTAANKHLAARGY